MTALADEGAIPREPRMGLSEGLTPLSQPQRYERVANYTICVPDIGGADRRVVDVGGDLELEQSLIVLESADGSVLCHHRAQDCLNCKGF